MSEESTAAAADNEKQFVIQKIYLKDVSFETPNSPHVFTQEWTPEVNVDLNTRSIKLDEGVFEVVLTVTVTARVGEGVGFLVEVQQAGIFTIGNFAEEELGAMVGSYCPNILFPFAREAVADLVAKGGFPQLLLAPINFDALYAEKLRQEQQAAH